MNTNKKLLWVALICVVAAAGIYSYAYWKVKTSVITHTSVPAAGKLAAASVADGTYTVRIRSIMTTPEDTAITFSHVTYFEGAEASSSAAHDVPCKDRPLEACTPSLAYGYYVRASGAPDFTAPIPHQAAIVLKDNAHGSLRDLQNIQRDHDPVFDISIQDGNVVSVIERTPLPAGKG